MHKAGFVNIIGLPNVGKSTLMNALIGERMSIISPKAQTTRHRILGMVNADDYQVVFSDTPGYINQPAYKLQMSMNHFVEGALQDADVLMFVTDKFQKEEEQIHLIELVRAAKVPCIWPCTRPNYPHLQHTAQPICWNALLCWPHCHGGVGR